MFPARINLGLLQIQAHCQLRPKVVAEEVEFLRT